jgi:hypothetical protein
MQTKQYQYVVGNGRHTSVVNPWYFGMDPDSAIFFIDLQELNLKKNVFLPVLLFEGTFTSVFKEKKSKRVTK